MSHDRLADIDTCCVRRMGGNVIDTGERASLWLSRGAGEQRGRRCPRGWKWLRVNVLLELFTLVQARSWVNRRGSCRSPGGGLCAAISRSLVSSSFLYLPHHDTSRHVFPRSAHALSACLSSRSRPQRLDASSNGNISRHGAEQCSTSPLSTQPGSGDAAGDKDISGTRQCGFMHAPPVPDLDDIRLGFSVHGLA